MKKILIIYLILFILIPKYAYSQNNEIENDKKPAIAMGITGLLVGASVVGALIINEPKMLSLHTENFVTRDFDENKNLEKININSNYALRYNFSDFFELSSGYLLGNNNNNTIILDSGLNFINPKVLNVERVGLSPVLRFGVTSLMRDFNQFGLGVYAKAGLMLRFEKIKFNFEGGYRYIDSGNFTINSFAFGGDLGYIF